MPHRPIMLGVVGDSAAGKTTLSVGIARLLGADRVTVICTDDYHRYNRIQRRAHGVTALHPDCNYIDIMEQHVEAIASARPILKPVYNHARGDFDPPEYVRPNRFVIVEGLLGFHTAALRDLYHVKVFLDPPEPLRREWKIRRDCAKRGYTAEQVAAELEQREPDSAAYIRPQRQYADVAVRFHAASERSDPERLDVRLALRPTLPTPDLSSVIGDGERAAMRIAVEREAGRLIECLEIDGAVSPEQAAAIEETIWSAQPSLRPRFPDEMGAFVYGREERRSLPLALTQLLISYHLLVGRLEKDQMLDRERAAVLS